jgi:hypothetical protein
MQEGRQRLCSNRGIYVLYMVVRFMTIYAISAYHHLMFESRSGEVSSIQPYMLKFVSDLRHGSLDPTPPHPPPPPESQ